MTELERKNRLIVTALAAQQIYAQCHDECIDLKFFKQDLKMHSKNLISKLERELMPMFAVLGNVDGGEAYLGAVEIMENTLQSLATLPVEYWALVYQGVSDIKRQIDEKNKASTERSLDPEADRVEATDGTKPDHHGSAEQPSGTQVNEDARAGEYAH